MGLTKRKRPGVKRKVEAGYTRGWYDWKKDRISLVCRKGGRSWVERVPARWYFTVKREEFKKFRGRARRLLSMVKDARPDGRYVRLYVPYRDRQDALDECRQIGLVPLEADVRPVERVMADADLKMAKPKVLFYDFESDPRWGFIVDDEGRTSPNPNSRIISIACKSSEGDEYKFRMLNLPDPSVLVDSMASDEWDYDLDVAEQDLIGWFLKIAANHDVLVAWNGAGFDKPLLELRCKDLGIYPPWRRLNFLDMMLLLQHPYYGYGRDEEATGVKASWKLDKLGEVLLGKRKLEGVSGAQSLEMFVSDPALLRKYNIRDVEIMQEIEDKMGYIQAHAVLAHLCGRFPSDRTLSSGYLNDGFTLRMGRDRGVRFPSVWYEERKEMDSEKITGATVLEPVPGLHENVQAVDFGSLYPNIIISLNISPETRVEQGTKLWRRLKREGKLAQAPDEMLETVDGPVVIPGPWFRQDVEGIVPATVKVALERREKHKAEMKRLEKLGLEGSTEWKIAKNHSDGWKVLANAYYGLLKSKFSRIYDRECARAVTAVGRELLKLIVSVAGKYGIPVLAGDTDSLFVRCSRKHADQLREKAAKAVDAWFVERGGVVGRVRLGHDGTWRRIFWTGKKHYAGVQVYPDGSEKVKVKGLEVVRTDVAKIAQTFVTEALDRLLNEPGFGVEKAKAMVREWNERTFAGDLELEDLAIRKAVNKPLREYDKDYPQVAAAKAMLEAGEEVFVGMKVGYVVIGTKPKTQVVPESMYTGGYDPIYYWTSQVYAPVQRLLEVVFPEHTVLASDGKVLSGGYGVRWKVYLKLRPTRQQALLPAM